MKISKNWALKYFHKKFDENFFETLITVIAFLFIQILLILIRLTYGPSQIFDLLLHKDLLQIQVGILTVIIGLFVYVVGTQRGNYWVRTAALIRVSKVFETTMIAVCGLFFPNTLSVAVSCAYTLYSLCSLTAMADNRVLEKEFNIIFNTLDGLLQNEFDRLE